MNSGSRHVQGVDESLIVCIGTRTVALGMCKGVDGLVYLFLGLHTLGLHVCNDIMLAFATSKKQILIVSIFAQRI